MWFIPGIRFFLFDALFIGRGGKRPLVVMVTKGEVSGGGVGGRVGGRRVSFVGRSDCLTFGDGFHCQLSWSQSRVQSL